MGNFHLFRSVVLILICFLLICGKATATLISASDLSHGPDSITIDTETGLQWLDLSSTVNRSYLAISSQLGAFGEFSGYRYATVEEVFEFFTHASIPDINVPATTNNYSAATIFIDLVDPSYAVHASGILLREAGAFTLSTENRLAPIVFVITREGLLPPNAEAYTEGSSGFIAQPYEGIGSWLVRSVPEPNILLLYLTRTFHKLREPSLVF